MKLYDLTLNQFLDRVDSATPTPGGGSVSALVIAQGISLIRMVAHLTIPKKKFRELCDDIKLDYMSRISALDDLKLEIVELIERDTQAFNKIMDAFKLPKNTEEEKNARVEAINKATIYATDVPLETARLALKALELAEPTFAYANKTATSDFGVGVHLIDAGLKGAILNVKTNMHSYTDSNLADKYYHEANVIEGKANTIVNRLVTLVNQEFNR